jgi:hypothetical protein
LRQNSQPLTKQPPPADSRVADARDGQNRPNPAGTRSNGFCGTHYDEARPWFSHKENYHGAFGLDVSRTRSLLLLELYSAINT